MDVCLEEADGQIEEADRSGRPRRPEKGANRRLVGDEDIHEAR